MGSKLTTGAIAVMVAVVLFAAGYVLLSGLGNPPSAYAGYAVGELQRLQVREDPPLRPTVEFVAENGETASLADYDGKVVLLNLWATWCAPCVREMPSLDRLAGALNSERFAVAPVSLDRAMEPARAFYDEQSLDNLPLYLDNSFAIARAVDTPGLPTTIVYGAHGQELARVANAVEWDSEEAVAFLSMLVEQEFPGAAQ